MKYARFEDLPVWKAGARLFVRVDALCDDKELNRRGDITDQIHRAALSITNNIAEGFEQGTTQQFITHLYHAKGSAGEVRSMLQTMLGMARLSHLKPEVTILRGEMENISRQLHGLADSLQNSEIDGVRYLNDEVRDKQERSNRREAFNVMLAGYIERGRLNREGEASAKTEDSASSETTG